MSQTMSSGSSSSSSSSWSSECGEFEVARVLANLAKRQVAVVAESDSGGGGGGGGGGGESVDGNWGSKGRRSGKRVRTDSELDPAHPSGLGSASGSVSGPNSVPLPFDLNVDQAAICDQEECENRCQVKVEEVCESAEPSPVSNGPHINGGRLRQNLTEEEKEARRLRRVLANRESARQTIRRRQALYEELTRKATELAAENENLKTSKEFAVKEFQSLQITNHKLKEQMCQTLGLKLGESWREAAKSSNVDTRNILPANWPFFICNTSSGTPLMMPSCMQPSADMKLSQVIQHGVTSKASMSTHQVNPCVLQKQENASSTNGQNMPWCIIPCPWFLPLPNVKINGANKHEEACISPQTGNGFMETPYVRTEVHTPTQPKPGNGFLETPYGFRHISCEKEACISPKTPPNIRVPSATGVRTEVHTPIQGKSRNGFFETPFGFCQLSYEKEDCISPNTPNTRVPSATSVQIVTQEQGKEQGANNVNRKKKDAIASTEARKRRKELMKLKSLHYYPTRAEYG